MFIRFEETVLAVLLPTDINFANLVKYVWRKLNLKDQNAVQLSYNICETKNSILNDGDVAVFKNLALKTPIHVQTLVVDHASHTPIAILFQPTPLRLTGVNYLPPPPPSPTFHFTEKKAGIKVNHMFQDKETCIYDISFKCLKEGYQFYVDSSSTTRYYVKCLQPECDWHIRCRRVGVTNRFKVSSMNDNHKCSKLVFHPNHRNAYAKTLARIITPKVADATRVYRPKDILDDLKLDMNIDVSYKRAWRGRHLALESNHGCPRASYEQLALYCHNLKLANRETVTDIETDADSRFKNLFIGFGVAVSALAPFYLFCLLKIIFVRDCFLNVTVL